MPQTLFILPQPFDWCEIPAGKVRLEEGGYIPDGGQTFEVPAFSMAKYPVTNAQYRLFVEAMGYQNKAWWTAKHWETKEIQNWTEPRFWSNTDYAAFCVDDKPVVGVSWYEAVAFCQWLSETSGEKINLPTDQQWQHAALGDDGRVYPWGNDWDCERCNNSVNPCESYATSPVTAYPNGTSPYGIFDMAGNVWEWCLTDYETGSSAVERTNGRVLRGASWSLDWADNFRCNLRFCGSPSHGSVYYGFRISRSLQ